MLRELPCEVERLRRAQDARSIRGDNARGDAHKQLNQT
jgi:hypothetical protein